MAISYLAVDLSTHPFLADSQIDLINWPAALFEPIHVYGKSYDGIKEATLMFDMLKVGTPIYAPFDGQIQQVTDQPESCDTEMYFTDNNNDQQHHLSYDHVKPLAGYLTKGSKFKAGDQIATVPAWECKQNFGRVEMMVVVGTTQVTASRCPLYLLDNARKATLTAQISTIQAWWNGLKPRTAYSAAELAPNGLCLTEFGNF